MTRFAPERRVLAAFYSGLAGAAAAGAESLSAPDLPPPATAESTDAQNALAPRVGEQSLEAVRYLALASQAERIRLGLVTIARLRVRLSREEVAQRRPRFSTIPSPKPPERWPRSARNCRLAPPRRVSRLA